MIKDLEAILEPLREEFVVANNTNQVQKQLDLIREIKTYQDQILVLERFRSVMEWDV